MSFNLGDCPNSNSNPDITGVGTRVALYVSVTWGLFMTTLLLPNEEDFRDVTRSAYITSTALCIAGLASLYVKDAGISIVDALCVTTMSSLVIVYACLSAIYWPRPNFEKAKVAYLPTGLALLLAFILHSALWTAFGFTVWSSPTTFGGAAILLNSTSSPVVPCDPNPDFSAQFWIVGYSIPITNGRLRAFALAFFGIGVFCSGAWILWRVLFFYFFYKARRDYLVQNLLKQPDEGIELERVGNAQAIAPAPPAGEVNGNGAVGEVEVPPAIQGGDGEGPGFQEIKAEGDRLNLLQSRWMLIPILFFAAAFVYLIWTTEKLISINGQRGNTSQLSFGQILSIALLLDQLFQSGTKVKEYLERWYIQQGYDTRRNRRAAREQARLANQEAHGH